MSIKVLIERRIKAFIKQYPEFSKEKTNKQFLFFSVFSLFKDSRISYEDILDGIVDGGEDYGIDGIFVFSSGQLIDEEELNTQITKGDKVKIQLIQVTRGPGFSETVLLKLKNGVEKIFDLQNNTKGNNNLSRKVTLIRKVWVRCFDLGNARDIEVECVYVCLSTTERLAKKITLLGEKIRKYLKKQELRNATIRYIGIPTLYRIITADAYEKEITFKELTPYAESYNTKVLGYYGLVKLKEFLRFITNDEGALEEIYFEGNVRDYYGIRKKVNQKIRDTISSQERMHFWCLNNGITVICEKCNQLGKKMKLFNFDIVNGCQTAHVLYESKDLLKNDEQSEILVKIVQTNDEEIANKIIDATNSQTAVSPLSLHSNELIQENIQEHFEKYKKMPLFYERRINYYKRRNKPSNRIVTMMKVFQVFYSTFEKKPSIARGRPTESFERHYDSVFNTDFDYDAYLYTYLMYLKLCTVNREAKKTGNKNYIWFLVRQYGILHIARIAFALFIRNDSKIQFKDKKNIFAKHKKKLERAINDEKTINALYLTSAKLLRKCILDFRKKDKEAVLSDSLFKNEDIDKKIGRELYKMLHSKE